MKYTIVTDGKLYALKRTGFLRRVAFMSFSTNSCWHPNQGGWHHRTSGYFNRCWVTKEQAERELRRRTA